MAKLDFGGGVSGAVSGATTGASIGSIIPGVGTAIGGAVGGLVGGIASLFGKKKKKKPKPISTLDPQQQALYKDYVSSIRGQGPFSDLYNYDTQGANQNFDANVSRPAYRNFQENIIPGITGQFRNNNLQNSTYTGEALGRAGRNVQENLDAQRSNMIFNGQQQAQQNKQNAIQNVLGTQTFAYSKPGPQNPSTIDQILGSLGGASGEWIADFLKKPSGNSSPGMAANAATYAGLPALFGKGR